MAGLIDPVVCLPRSFPFGLLCCLVGAIHGARCHAYVLIATCCRKDQLPGASAREILESTDFCL